MHAPFLYLKAQEALRTRAQNQQRYAWVKNARPNQLPPPGEWRTWLILAGRGFGKTRTGAETLRSWITSGRYRRAELLTERQGALWRRDLIPYREPPYDEKGALKLARIVIAIDPATTHHEESDETGIVIAGLSDDNDAYVLEDLSGRLSPGEWGQRVCEAYWRLKADRVVAEVNKGGDLVERILRSIDPTIPYKAVRATRGKFTRAEPVAALYEQRRVFHARPLSLLETQLCAYVPGITPKSPDRLDAMVWALTDLFLESEANPALKVWTSK